MSVCFIAATASAAFAQATGSTTGKCAFQTLNFPPPATKGTPVALNDSGAILGGFSETPFDAHGFLLYQGKLTTFMFPGSALTSALDISRNGIIVGNFSVNVGDGDQHPFMVHSGGFHKITLPGFPNADATAAGVNANGDVVGVITSETAAPAIGYLLHNGKLTQLSFPGATGGTQPTSINDQGVIVGSYFIASVNSNPAFMWKDGVFSNINPPGNDGFVNVTKISNSGVVVGSYEAADGHAHGFAFKDGTYTKIDVPGSSDTFILAVNKFDNVLVQAEIPGLNTSKIIEAKGFCAAAF
jgi:probable HAF family extracellular repeat protein